MDDYQYPQNKILVLSHDSHIFSQTQLLKDLFHYNTTSATIVKSQTWENKYYKTSFDLYIDSFASLPEWMKDFVTPECEPLRNVMAGIILLTDNKLINPQEFLQPLLGVLHPNTFIVVVNINEEVEQDEIDGLNEAWNNGFTNVIEFINWTKSRATIGHNEYGERLGLDRIHEIIDTHDWLNCELQPIATRVEEPAYDMPLEQLITNLQSARLRYKSMGNNDEADVFANEMANELSKYL
ncbi:hypothetical protein SEUBUCD646_0F01060 [Saccharomyces eubayanus]|uniref:Increased recombination centers protein 6 n=2 Tax=Saccharomyces TaxID=4930 RepID=A0A6C1E685_SACPS|nr:Increased recombination centers protein 6 [Saccharomyces pastorianus]CAI1974548.1 hypothetical protein SEUBUCD650_0F01040 [Saccharomyces eubayanus]CAI2003354.1 hypothetical protein SEUBUCD646_0F01060 [Saccharomyces eubayanus]